MEDKNKAVPLDDMPSNLSGKVVSEDDMPTGLSSPKPTAPSTQGGESGALKPTVPTPSKGSTSLLEDIESESWKKTISPKPAVTPSTTKGEAKTFPISKETFDRMKVKGENVFEKDGKYFQTKSNIPSAVKGGKEFAPTVQEDIAKIEGITMKVKYPEYSKPAQREQFDFKSESAKALTNEQKAEKEQTLQRKEERRLQNLPQEIDRLREERAGLLLDKSTEGKKKLAANEAVTKKMQQEVNAINNSKYQSLQNLNQKAIKGVDLEINEYLQEDLKLRDKITKVGLNDEETWYLVQRAVTKKIAPLEKDLQTFKEEGTIDNASEKIRLSNELHSKQQKMAGIANQMKSYEEDYLNKNGFSGLAKEIDLTKKKLDSYLPAIEKAKSEVKLHEKELSDLKTKLESFDSLIKDNTFYGNSAQLEDLKATEKEFNETLEDLNKVYAKQELVGYEDVVSRYNALVSKKNSIAQNLVSPAYAKMKGDFDALKTEYDLSYNKYLEFEQPEVKDRIGKYFSTIQKIGEYDEKLKKAKGSLTSLKEIEDIQKRFEDLGLYGDVLDIGGRAVNSILDASKKLVMSPFRIASSLSDVAGSGSDVYHYSEWIADIIEKPKPFAVKEKNVLYDAARDKINWGVVPVLSGLADQTGIILTLALTGKYATPALQRTMTTAGMDLTAAAEMAESAKIASTIAPAFAISYGDNYKEARSKGFGTSGAIAYSSAMSLLEGITELILPDQDLVFGKGVKEQMLNRFIKDYAKGKKYAIKKLASDFIYNAGGELTEENIAALGGVITTSIGSLTNDDIEVEIPTINQTVATSITSGLAGGGMGLFGKISESSQIYKMGVMNLAKDFDNGKDFLTKLKEKGKIDEARYNKLITDAQKYQSVSGKIPSGLSKYKTFAIAEKMIAINDLYSQMDKDEKNPINKINKKKINSIQDEIEGIIDDKEFDKRMEAELNAEAQELIKEEEASQPILKKNTSPTNEKYGTINRNDGKGVVDLTKEEYLREEGKLAGVEEQLNEQEDVDIQQQVDEEKADDRAVGDIAKEDNAYQESRQITEEVSRENPDASILITPKGNDLNLTALYVGKENRGKGIGSKVLESVKKQADKVGKKVVLDATNELDEETDLERLGKFYEANGFTKVGDNKFEYNPNKGDIAKKGEAVSKEESDVESTAKALEEGDKIQWNVFGNEESGEWNVVGKTKTKGGKDAVILSKVYVKASSDGKSYTKEYADANGIKYDNESTVEHIVPLEDLKSESLLSKEQAPKQKEDEQEKPTKEDGKPLPKGVQGLRNEGERGEESPELRPEEKGIDLPENKEGNYNKQFAGAKKIYGEETTIEMPNGETKEAQFVVVELDSILASHDEVSFNDTEGFPKTKEGRNVNSRNYKGDKAAQLKVNSDATNLKPTIVISDAATTDTGVPVLSKEGIVVSGNGRTMAVKLSQKIAPQKYQAYKENLIKRAAKFGLDPNEVSKMKNPVLVKLDRSIGNYSVKLFDDYNGRFQKEESPIDKAIKRSTIIQDNPDLKERILSVIGRHETMSDLFENKEDRKELFKILLDNDVILKQEVAKYVTDAGEFTPDGKDVVNDILIATVLRPETLEATESVKAFRNKIINALPVLTANYRLGDNSLENELNEAVLLQAKIASMGNQSEFWKHLKQLGVFDVVNPNLVILNRIIDSGSQNFKKFIVKYNKSMEVDENNLFGGTEAFTKKEVIDELKKTILDEKERQIISNLEELYRDFEQRRQDGAVEVDGRISKEEQAGEPKPTEEKVSGGLTEAEKSNLEAIGKDAGINFQEVRNVYNKYGEGKPLSEITLEDYQRAEEKRGKGKKATKQSVQEGQIDINGYKFTDTPSLRTGVSVEKIDTPANVIEADVFVSDKKNVLQQGATRLENGWIKFMQTTDGNTYLYNENSGETVLLKSEKGGIMGIVENDFVKNNPREKQSAQEEIDNLFNVYESIEDSKGMEKREAAEEFRNMQESIKSPTLKRIFDNIKDIHSQLEKQGLITKTKGCP